MDDFKVSYGHRVDELDVPLKQVFFSEIFEYLKTGGMHRSIIEQLRKIPNKKKRQEFKKKHLPYFNLGRFKGKRNNDALIKTRYAIFDIDDLPNKEAVQEYKAHYTDDRRVFLCFTSPSGNGLKIVFRFEKLITNHKKFSDLYKYYSNKIFQTIPTDKTSDVSRACFLSYDSELYHNPECENLPIDVNLSKSVSKDTQGSKVPPTGDYSENNYKYVPDVVQYLKGKINDYDTWMRAGMALAEMGEEGRKYWYILSDNVNYDDSLEQLNLKFDNFLNTRKDITIATLFQIGKERGFKYQNNQNIINIPEYSESESSEDILIKYAEYRITDKIEIEKPKPIITINGSSISTPGNITVISGASKSSKSALCSVILAGAIRIDDIFYDGFKEIEIEQNEDHKAVIHIDTEQSKYHHYDNLKHAVLNRSGLSNLPEFFHSYNIRKLPIKEYQLICSDIFQACYHKYDGIHAAVIDGIADFITSVNDESESNGIVHYFETLAINYNTPIITVIHLNPNSDKERGHLGSQLQRKAESVIAVRKDGDISYINPKELRTANFADIPAIQYKYDKIKRYHVYAGIRIIEKVDSEAQRFEIISDEVFSNGPIKYTEAVSNISDMTGRKERTAKTYIQEMLQLELIEKREDGYVKK